jgi:hypothetical protein
MSRRPIRHYTLNPVFKVNSLGRLIPLSRWPHPIPFRTHRLVSTALILAVLETGISLLVFVYLLVVYSGLLLLFGFTDESSDPTRWPFIDDCQNTCLCSMIDLILDRSPSLLPWWMVDLVRSTPRPSRMRERCSDNKPVIRTTWQLNPRTIRTHPTTRHRDTGSKTLLKTLDLSLAILSMIWSPSRMSRLRLAVGTWLGEVRYRSTRDRLVSRLYRAVHSSLGSTTTSLSRVRHGHSLHFSPLGHCGSGRKAAPQYWTSPFSLLSVSYSFSLHSLIVDCKSYTIPLFLLVSRC